MSELADVRAETRGGHPPGSPARVARYDVVIIGGGIAGVAVCETLARRTDLRILVVDRADQLGTGSSGRLEGWFHAGALYAGLADPLIFKNCLRSLEHLYNAYSGYPHCNVHLEPRGPGRGPRIPTIDPRADDGERWFNPEPLHYILPTERAPDFAIGEERPLTRYPLWAIQRSFMLRRLRRAYEEHDWYVGGRCQAPDVMEANEPAGSGAALPEAHAWREAHEELQAYSERFDSCFAGGSPSKSYEFFASPDRTMNPGRILRDLAAGALASGRVQVMTGATLEEMVKTAHHRIRSLVVRTREDQRIHVKADFFVVAAGSGSDTLCSDAWFPLDDRISDVQSAMVVVSPALSEFSFARMALDPAFHFNHLYRRHASGGYSLLADSGYFEADRGSGAHSAEHMLEQAERYFGRAALYAEGRRIFEYACHKTEFVPSDARKRSYSYWIQLGRGGNYLYAVPGKFSQFPTVAVETYRKLRDSGRFGDRAKGWQSPDPENANPLPGLEEFRQQAHGLVSAPMPQALIDSP